MKPTNAGENLLDLDYTMKLKAILCFVLLVYFTPGAKLGGVVSSKQLDFICIEYFIHQDTVNMPAPLQQFQPRKSSNYWQLRNIYSRLQRLILKRQFLDRCKERKVIPRGLRVNFNLAFETKDIMLCQAIKDVLNNTSSRIFDLVKDQVSIFIKRQEECFHTTRTDLAQKIGVHNVNELLGVIRKHIQKEVETEKKKHARKLYILERSINLNDTSVQIGSRKITASNYISHKPNGIAVKNVRPHRKNRGRGHRKPEDNKKQNLNYVPTERDLKKYDPIVLANNVKLTPEQISICRLPDGFAPTPKEPIDVCDMVVGTHRWAERLRWHRFFQQQEDDPNKQPEENFIKHPWYRPTTRAAPRNDPALEAFIQACTTDFLAIDKRRKIKDNLTKDQRTALAQLRALPRTHDAACRYADKTGTTIITSLKDDDEKIMKELTNKNFYDIIPSNPIPLIKNKIKTWAQSWLEKGKVDTDIVNYVNDLDGKQPGKCKLLIKTHKNKPYPTRLLLSGCGTPVENLSKFVQTSINHLHDHLTYQIIDTKEFLKKIMMINDTLAPLPSETTLAVCDVVALFPNVNNSMGIPAISKMLDKFPPTNIKTSKDCILDALEICLENNVCKYTDSQDRTIFACPNHGTAMGPAHSCEYVDVYMGELDNKLVDTSPVPLISSLTLSDKDKFKYLDWSRFRDDGFAVLLKEDHVKKFEHHLQSLNPPNIKWTVNYGKEVTYLDVRLHISEGKIITDVFSKHNHAYLPPNSCHSPAVFKGLLSSVGTRLRMICSEDEDLKGKIEEYSRYFAMSGWDYRKAKRELNKGAKTDRRTLLMKGKPKQKKKIAWVTNYDPRYPSKSEIIRKNLHILYSNPQNKNIFKKNQIISSDRRRKNLGEIYKPTVPKRQSHQEHKLEPGYFTCQARRCDTCLHGENTKGFRSPWDNRHWVIRKHLTCTTKNVIYLIKCKIHPDQLYVGSTKNLKYRWANHKSDTKLHKTTKCMVSKHVCTNHHPKSENLEFLQIIAIDSVHDEKQLLQRETYWMCNLGTIFKGLNDRKEIAIMQSKYV